MASFRTGFKIFSEFSVKQGLGRIRSFSEDRKPGRWLPEDQWAVRQPGSTCPEPCDKPKKPPKPSKSWLSVCKDPEPPIECDVRHSNCPPPPVKEEGPWYSLDNLIPKKKPEKPPPLRSCREEMKRREMTQEEEEEVCENIVDKTFTVDIKPEFPECCMPKQDPCPAPVVTLSCPLPKELDIMLWCGRPSRDTSRIAAKCQTDRLPYEEFRPRKCWKPPPFSLPIRGAAPPQSPCCRGAIAYAEFKHVEVPKPLYTRYKSVNLTDSSTLLCMVNATCPDDESAKSLAIAPPSPPPFPHPPFPTPCCPSAADDADYEAENETEACPEKRVIQTGSCKPVPIKKAPKYKFRPKPTKLIERRVYKNPCAQHKNCNLPFRPTPESQENESCSAKNCDDGQQPKVITGTLTDEPQTFERNVPLSCEPPNWMYFLCKPGSKETPLVPKSGDVPKEPDWSSETDGLKFYDGNDGCIKPKPPPDPCLAIADERKIREDPPETPEAPQAPEPPCPPPPEPAVKEFINRFVLMPGHYNIKNNRPEDPCAARNECQSTSLEKFIDTKTAQTKKSTKSYPPIKENILYDLQRLCPNVPVDPSKLMVPCRKPPEPECPEFPRFYRSYSTFTPSTLRNFSPVQLIKLQRRTDCGDSSGKCKLRNIEPKRECPEKKEPPIYGEITLPCCPKARQPPNCQIRKPMPPCKKKLAPKPSFSECAKDPPPCPKITECNCWEKKPGKNGRKFSDWAAVRSDNGLGRLGENAKEGEIKTSKSSHFFKYLDSHSKDHYAGKVKCSTLKSVHASTGDAALYKCMLGLKDGSDDKTCEYEQRMVVSKQKKRREKMKKNKSNFRGNEVLLAKRDFQVDGFLKSNIAKEDEVSLTVCHSPEENEDNGRVFMGSIGSWINDFFNVPPKKPQTAPSGERKGLRMEKEPPPDKNSEYYKTVTALKERFRKKLEKETTVHIFAGERLLELDFDRITDDDKKPKSGTRPPQSSSIQNDLDEINDILENREPAQRPVCDLKRQENSLNLGPPLQTFKRDAPPIPEDTNFQKKKKPRKSRPKLREIEDIVFFPTPRELTKRLLLNVNDQEKCSQLYKNSLLAAQEGQPYGQRKSGAYQSNTRCYTTDANLIESECPPDVKRGTRSANKDVTETHPVGPAHSKIPKKLCKFSRASSTYVKAKTPKMPIVPQVKSECMATSDELVKYLMKKTKLTGRPLNSKKKHAALSSVFPSKNQRIMQSATNSLVNSVLAKRESDSQVVKSPRVSSELRLHSPRFDVRRSVSPSGFNRASYLCGEDRMNELCFYERTNYRNLRRQNLDALKRDMKVSSEKFAKRQEVKSMSSRLDSKSAAYQVSKIKQKDQKKAFAKSDSENCKIAESREAQNARFQKQHELFKNNLKGGVQGTEIIPSADKETELEEPSPLEPETTSKELTVINNSNVQLVPQPAEETNQRELAVEWSLQPHQQPQPQQQQLQQQQMPPPPPQQQQQQQQSPPAEESDFELMDCLAVDEKPVVEYRERERIPERQSGVREKMYKIKSLPYKKEEDAKQLLGQLQEYCKNEPPNQKNVKVYEPPICSPELRRVKSLDTILMNRRYSTKTIDATRQMLRSNWLYQTALLGNRLLDDPDKNKKDQKDKKDGEDSESDPVATKESECKSDKPKKPGPRCDKDEFTS